MSGTRLCVSALLMVQLVCAFPISETGTRPQPLMEIQDLLDRLEELVEQRPVPEEVSRSQSGEERPVEEGPPEDLEHLEELLLKQLLSKDLRTVKNNKSSSSGCFGRRLDRIGSSSSLGCNTGSRTSPRSV